MDDVLGADGGVCLGYGPEQLLGESRREAAIERFRLEARTIARVTSPNTVRLYDFGVSETGGFYFVMELLTGMDVFSLVQRFGPLPPERVVAVLRQACRSLADAHAAGVLHRDRDVTLGPGELFVVPRGVEHRPIAEDEVHILLIEPTNTPNTGDPITAAARRVI